MPIAPRRALPRCSAGITTGFIFRAVSRTGAIWGNHITPKAIWHVEQIQFLLGHVSVQTTERYLGCKQKLRNAVNDGIDLAEA